MQALPWQPSESLQCWLTKDKGGFSAAEVGTGTGLESLVHWLTQAPGSFCAMEVGAGRPLRVYHAG